MESIETIKTRLRSVLPTVADGVIAELDAAESAVSNAEAVLAAAKDTVAVREKQLRDLTAVAAASLTSGQRVAIQALAARVTRQAAEPDQTDGESVGP